MALGTMQMTTYLTPPPDFGSSKKSFIFKILSSFGVTSRALRLGNQQVTNANQR